MNIEPILSIDDILNYISEDEMEKAVEIIKLTKKELGMDVTVFKPDYSTMTTPGATATHAYAMRLNDEGSLVIFRSGWGFPPNGNDLDIFVTRTYWRLSALIMIYDLKISDKLSDFLF